MLGNGPRIALVHDYWVTFRGGERMFLGLRRLFPRADCFALMAPRMTLPAEMAAIPIRGSFLGHLPGSQKYYRAYLPLYPLAARSLNLAAYDVVISSSSGFTHQVRPRGLHLCYCYAPLRYAWNEYEATLARQRSPIMRAALGHVLRATRRADQRVAPSVTAYIAISTTTQRRIAEYYQRESTIVYPFVDMPRFAPRQGAGEYFLAIAQLLPYKRVDVAVRACTLLNLPLVVVGVGPELANLERIAGPSVKFLGRVAEARMPELYAHATALLQCGEEDFGITALEAQASGCPVLALARGGALETVRDGVSGYLFTEPTPEALLEALDRLRAQPLDPAAIRDHAAHFDEDHFRAGIRAVLQREWQRAGHASLDGV